MKYLFFALAMLLLSCAKQEKVRDSERTAYAMPHVQDTTSHRNDGDSIIKQTILVLPPYDEIANAGISPPVHEYLEGALAKDSAMSLIKFPFKELMNVSYHNVFDKKYCKPILEKVSADVVVMSMIDQSKSTGNMDLDTWNLSLRIYYPDDDLQIDSKILFSALTNEEIKKSIYLRRKDLVSEIQKTR